MRVALAVLAALALGGCYRGNHAACELACESASECQAFAEFGAQASCDHNLCSTIGHTCSPVVGDGGIADGGSGGGDAGVDAGPPVPDVIAVSAGTGYACAIDANRQLSCWGANAGSVVAGDRGVAVATPIARPGTWAQVSAGAQHACGVLLDGTGYCWGQNASGECAVDPTVHSVVTDPMPITLQGNLLWTKIVAGSDHSCGLAGTTIYCWGANESGQYGTSSAGSASPTPLVSDEQWRDVWAGPGITCGLATSGSLYCWGDASPDGRLGNGSTVTMRPPTVVANFASADPPIDVSIGRVAVCGVTGSGILRCWGSNFSGAVGANDPTGGVSVTAPVVIDTGKTWTAVSTGGTVTCGVEGGGAMQCWGTGLAGGVGNGHWTTLDSPPTTVLGAGATIVAVGDGLGTFASHHGTDEDVDLGCAAIGGKLSCWGANNFGQLGTGAPGRVARPTPIPLAAGTTVSHLVSGDHHACAIVNGSVACWGTTERGEADGATSSGFGSDAACVAGSPCDVDRPTPLVPPVKPKETVLLPPQLAAGPDFTCALVSGQVTCWGSNRATQLGDSTRSDLRVSQTLAGPETFALLATAQQACALDQNLDARCWGHVELEQDQPADTTPRYTTVVGIAFNAMTGAILHLDGTLEWVGANTSDVYGTGTNDVAFTAPPATDQSFTTRLSTIALSQDSGAPFACGLTTGATSTLECWGDNTVDQVTNQGASPQAMPVMLGAATAVSIGELHTCALMSGSGGDIACWGDDTFGQLGTGSATDAPVGVTTIERLDGGSPWAEVAAGATSTCAINLAGTLACWGDGMHGELGNGGGAAAYPGERHVQLPQ